MIYEVQDGKGYRLCHQNSGATLCGGLQVVYSKEDTLQAQQVWKFFQRLNGMRFVIKTSVIVVFGVLLIGAILGGQTQEVHAQALSSCSTNDRTYVVAVGDTLGRIAARYHVSVATLATHNRIANPNLIDTHETICIPGSDKGTTRVPTLVVPSPSVQIHPLAPVGVRNVFPFGSCTWWAAQRYYQIHKVFVPWITQANAGQWVARAYQFGWHVSRTPKVGDIMVLQSGVQGASRLGHVAVVEQVLRNGHVIASSMNWGSRRWAVTTWQFTPGAGVSFVRR